jgi:prepilin-type N-terminal cleavage/methylation domain-containing protein
VGRAVPPRKGFTLVELLVVIGIIALLMSILLPTLGSVRERANAIKCGSNLRQVGLAFVMYTQENRGFMPDRNASRSYLPAGRISDWIYWQEGRALEDSNVLRYLGVGKNPDLLRCPSDDWSVRNLNGNAASVGAYTFSYTANVFIMTNEQIPSTYNGSNYLKPLNVSRVRNQAEKILCIEEDERTINDGVWMGFPRSGVPDTPPNDFLAIRHERRRIEPDNDTNWTANLDRRGNAVFLDGHNEFVSRREAHNIGRLDPFRALQ